jgi:hypothetical protein
MAVLHRKRNKPASSAGVMVTPAPTVLVPAAATSYMSQARFHADPGHLPRKERDRMSTFDQRKDAFENKFAHDEELRFKATARRNKLLGLWAAEKLGKSGADADAYAKSVVVADFEEAGDEDVVRKVKADFGAGSVAVTDAEIRKVMTELLIKAGEDIQAGR